MKNLEIDMQRLQAIPIAIDTLITELAQASEDFSRYVQALNGNEPEAARRNLKKKEKSLTLLLSHFRALKARGTTIVALDDAKGAENISRGIVQQVVEINHQKDPDWQFTNDDFASAEMLLWTVASLLKAQEYIRTANVDESNALRQYANTKHKDIPQIASRVDLMTREVAFELTEVWDNDRPLTEEEH